MIRQSVISSLEVLVENVELDNLVDVNKENYAHVIYEYKLNKNIVECQCSEDRSNVCLTKHGHGFVVVLNNGSKSLIGNSCIKKFDSDSDIRKHINMLRNQQKRIDKLESIRKYYENYDEFLSQLDSMTSKVIDVLNLKNIFIEHLANERKNFTKSSESIKVVGGKVRNYIDENGNNREETSKASYSLGSISGKHIIDSKDLFDSFFEEKERFLKGMNNIKVLLDKVEFEDPSESKINAYRLQLEALYEVRRLSDEIVIGWNAFKTNSSSNLVFAYSKPYKLVKYFLKNTNLDVKKYCNTIRNDFKKNNNLDFISIH